MLPITPHQPSTHRRNDNHNRHSHRNQFFGNSATRSIALRATLPRRLHTDRPTILINDTPEA